MLKRKADRKVNASSKRAAKTELSRRTLKGRLSTKELKLLLSGQLSDKEVGQLLLSAASRE